MASRAALSAESSVGDGRTAASVEVLAGIQLVAFALLDVGGTPALLPPGIWPIDGLFLVPPFACLGACALSRRRQNGLSVPFRWFTATVFLGASLVAASAGLFGVASPSPRIGRLAILGFVVGIIMTGGGLVATGFVAVADPNAPSPAGLVLLGWPLATLVGIGLLVLFDVGTVVAASLGPLGSALTISGSAWLVRSKAPEVGTRRPYPRTG